MSVTEIVIAYESGLITQGEAVEQALVDTVDELYRLSDDADERRGDWLIRNHPAISPTRQMDFSGHFEFLSGGSASRVVELDFSKT